MVTNLPRMTDIRSVISNENMSAKDKFNSMSRLTQSLNNDSKYMDMKEFTGLAAIVLKVKDLYDNGVPCDRIASCLNKITNNNVLTDRVEDLTLTQTLVDPKGTDIDDEKALQSDEETEKSEDSKNEDEIASSQSSISSKT